MDEFLSMDLALAMVSANEAIAFFDDFYDKRNGYAAAYEAVKFEGPDSVGNRSRSGTVFGKDVSSSITAQSKTLDKFKYHASSMLIHIYNAVAKIFTVILNVVKAIIRVILAPFKLLYKAVTGKEIGKTAQQEMEGAVNKYRKDLNKYLPVIMDTSISLVNEADGIMTKMFPIVERVALASVPIIGKATYSEKTYGKQNIDGLKAMNDNFKERVEKGKATVERASQSLVPILDKVHAEVAKIRKRHPDFKGDTRQLVVCYAVNPSLIINLQKTSNDVEISANHAIQKTMKLADKAKNEKEVTSHAVQAAKVCNEVANTCLNAVRVYRDALMILKVAPGADSTLSNDQKYTVAIS